ncbi:MAG TPA: OsmC family peroxiredoxin [Bacteroidetes bacterium]|nr:OsmC family peroxiredoxin [Bacteroidota bacterium]
MSKKTIHVEWTGQGRQFTGFTPGGILLAIDGNENTGTSPMTLLLHAEAACSAIDVVDILQKMRQTISSFRIEVEAVRAEGDYPKVWEKIHLIFRLSGEIELEKAQHAIKLSLEKYCSVSAMLSSAAVISSELVLN